MITLLKLRLATVCFSKFIVDFKALGRPLPSRNRYAGRTRGLRITIDRAKQKSKNSHNTYKYYENCVIPFHIFINYVRMHRWFCLKYNCFKTNISVGNYAICKYSYQKIEIFFSRLITRQRESTGVPRDFRKQFFHLRLATNRWLSSFCS